MFVLFRINDKKGLLEMGRGHITTEKETRRRTGEIFMKAKKYEFGCVEFLTALVSPRFWFVHR